MVLLTVLGFPVALVIAWAFEMTPEGLKRDANMAPNEYIPRWSTRRFAALIVSIAILAAGVPLFQLSRSKPTWVPWTDVAPTPSQKSIAVLPLLNESGNPDDEYFSDGLSEELIAALAQIKELKVIGRSSSFRFKNEKEDSKSIGEKLGVSTLLEGTVRKNGDRVRIVAELVNAADGTELWSQTFDRELKDIFAVQAEIAQAVAASLELTLLGSKDNPTTMASTKSMEAHNAYLQGHFYLEHRNLEDYRKAVDFFDQAIRFDSDYALAYAERSEAWAWIGDLTSEKKKEAWKAAGSDAEKAVAVDPNLAEAHAALGWVRFFIQWQFMEGLSELRRAQQLSPGNPTASDLLARVVIYLGQFGEAEKMAQNRLNSTPSPTKPDQPGPCSFCRGKTRRDRRCGSQGRGTAADRPGNHRFQVFAAIQRGDGEAALREAKLEPNEGYRRFELALAYYARGERRAANEALAELIAKDRDFLAYQVAQVYAWRGENDKAFEWLQVSLDTHDTGTVSLLIDPLLHGLQHDPRYNSLLAKIGLPTKQTF